MKPNSEGNVYRVRWKKLASGFTAWLSRVPKLQVTGKDQEEISEQLFEITMDRFGDGEPCFDFDPPFTAEASERSYFEPEWFELSSNEHFRTVGDKSPFFAKGLCSYCGAGQGRRTNVPRVLDGVPRSDFAFIWHASPTAYIVSEDFVRFFQRVLGSNLRAVPCIPAKKTKKLFFELELTPQIRLEPHKSATDTFGVVCPRCKKENCGSFVCPEIGKGIYTAVERSKVTRLKCKAVVAASDLSRRICVNALVAKRLKAGSGLKGVLLDRLVMLEEGQVGKFKLAKAEKKSR